MGLIKREDDSLYNANMTNVEMTSNNHLSFSIVNICFTLSKNKEEAYKNLSPRKKRKSLSSPSGLRSGILSLVL